MFCDNENRETSLFLYFFLTVQRHKLRAPKNHRFELSNSDRTVAQNWINFYKALSCQIKGSRDCFRLMASVTFVASVVTY
jgi:hypothetical protein